MKKRNGWVGNSSSSSFIILMGDPKTKEDFSSWFEDDCSYYPKEKEILINKYKKIIEQLQKDIKEGKEPLVNINDFLTKTKFEEKYEIEDYYTFIKYLRDNYTIFIDDKNQKITKFMDWHFYERDITTNKIIDWLWDLYQNKKLLEVENNKIITNYRQRGIFVLENWKEQLDDENSYLFQAIQESIENDLILNKEIENHPDLLASRYRDMGYCIYDFKDVPYFKEFTKALTKKYIEDLKYRDKEGLDGLQCLIITFTTDDDKATDFDYLGRSGVITKNAILNIRDEYS